jgi:phosphoesterase RecJ-like protein
LNYKWNEVAAQALFVGIVTDSNRFLYHGTNASTFLIASQLTEYPFDLDAIYRMLYVEPLPLVKLRAKMMLSFQETKHHVAYIMTKKADWMESGVDFQTISRDMVRTMSGIEGIYIWVNFTEDESSNVVAEIRSNTMNINPVATKYGGGGHAFASGAYLDSFDKAYQMLEDLDHMMEEYYEHQKR